MSKKKQKFNVKSCPFCGGQNMRVKYTPSYVRQIEYWVTCRDCHSRTGYHKTPEEAADASLIVHAVDGSHADPVGQIEAVNAVLSTVPGAKDIDTIIVFNKSDLTDPAVSGRLKSIMPQSFSVSSVTGEGISQLREEIERRLPRPNVRVEAVIPYSEGALESKIREYGNVESVEYLNEGIRITAHVSEELSSAIVSVAVQ